MGRRRDSSPPVGPPPSELTAADLASLKPTTLPSTSATCEESGSRRMKYATRSSQTSGRYLPVMRSSMRQIDSISSSLTGRMRTPAIARV